jgi:short-subunit dehydrogenase
VTGASSGIGRALAEELARRGSNLILAARSVDVMTTDASHLRHVYGVDADVVDVDLSDPSDRARLVARCFEQEIDILINSAGSGLQGGFVALDATRQLALVELNCAAMVDLTHAFLPGMLERGFGGVMNLASVAAFQAVPRMAVYGASKAFVLSFSEAISAESAGAGVHVLAVCPGPIASKFSLGFASNRVADRIFANAPSAESIAGPSLDALADGRVIFVPGLMNRLSLIARRLLPRAVVTMATQKALE